MTAKKKTPRQLIAEALREARGAAKLTLAEAADKLGVHLMTVAKWEQAQRLPPLDDLPLIAKVYKLTSPDLVARLFHFVP